MEDIIKKYKFCSSQIEIPLVLSKMAMNLAMEIDKSIVIETEKDFHVTIKHGIIEINPDMVRKMVEYVKPFHITFGKIGIFEKPEEDVVYVEVKDSIGSGGLVQLRRIFDKLEEENAPSYARYVPHMTLAYIKKGAGASFRGMRTHINGITLPVTEIEYCSKNGTKHTCPLGTGNSLKSIYEINSKVIQE